MLVSSRLRRAVVIESNVATRDAAGGTTTSWADFSGTIYAEIAPLSAKEWIAGGGVTSQVDTRITIRFLPGVKPSMRLRALDDGALYNIAGVLPDASRGREYLTLVASSGANNG